jgi:hypothetical protein
VRLYDPETKFVVIWDNLCCGENVSVHKSWADMKKTIDEYPMTTVLAIYSVGMVVNPVAIYGERRTSMKRDRRLNMMDRRDEQETDRRQTK